MTCSELLIARASKPNSYNRDVTSDFFVAILILKWPFEPTIVREVIVILSKNYLDKSETLGTKNIKAVIT